MKKTDSDYYYYVVRFNIKKYRKQKNLTAQELADLTGFTHQFIRDLESLKINRRPRLDTIARISSALEVDIKQFLDDTDIDFENM